MEKLLQYHTEIYIVCNFFRTFILYRFINLFFYSEEHQRKVQKRVIFWSYALINSGIYLFIDHPIITILTNIFMYLLLTLVFQGRLQTKIIAAFAVLAMGMLCESIVFRGALFSGLGQAESLLITYVLSDFLFYIIVLFLENAFDLRAGNEVSITGSLYTIIVPVLTAIMDTYVLSVSENQRMNLVIISGLFVINILFFYFYKDEIYKNRLLYEKKLLENQNATYEKQIEIIENSNEMINRLRHDYKNHFYSIHAILATMENQEIKEYLNRMTQFVGNAQGEPFTGNAKLDSLLHYKKTVLENMGASIEIDLKLPKNLAIPLFDLTVIFGNILDNAIEALSHMEEKIFQLKGSYQKGTVYLVFKNSYDGSVVQKNGALLSTKENPKEHGMGLKNVTLVLEKYHGNLETSFDETYFYSKVFLYI